MVYLTVCYVIQMDLHSAFGINFHAVQDKSSLVAGAVEDNSSSNNNTIHKSASAQGLSIQEKQR